MGRARGSCGAWGQTWTARGAKRARRLFPERCWTSRSKFCRGDCRNACKHTGRLGVGLLRMEIHVVFTLSHRRVPATVETMFRAARRVAFAVEQVVKAVGGSGGGGNDRGRSGA